MNETSELEFNDYSSFLTRAQRASESLRRASDALARVAGGKPWSGSQALAAGTLSLGDAETAMRSLYAYSDYIETRATYVESLASVYAEQEAEARA